MFREDCLRDCTQQTFLPEPYPPMRADFSAIITAAFEGLRKIAQAVGGVKEVETEEQFGLW